MKNHEERMSTVHWPLGNQRGIALLYLVLFFVLFGVLLSIGSGMLGSAVARSKATDTKSGLERGVQTITAWAVKNGRLPVTAPSDEYSALFGATPLDAWSKPVVYIYDGNLTSASTGGVCGRSSTSISYQGQDVAFLLASGGGSMSIASTPNVNGPFSGAPTGPQATDIYRVVTLNELRAQAGCAGSTQGDLRIANNELPIACNGISYSVTLYGDGGVAPLSYAFSGLPVGLANAGAVISGTAIVNGAYPVVVTATDSQLPGARSVQRKYTLTVKSCP